VALADSPKATLSIGSTWLYEHWFKSSIDFAYDERIKDYNWYLVLGV